MFASLQVLHVAVDHLERDREELCEIAMETRAAGAAHRTAGPNTDSRFQEGSAAPRRGETHLCVSVVESVVLLL